MRNYLITSEHVLGSPRHNELLYQFAVKIVELGCQQVGESELFTLEVGILLMYSKL